MNVEALRTERLLLRGWTPEDRAPFRALNRDAEVMRYFPSALDDAESDALADRIEAHFRTHGFGPYAVESLEERRFLGFVGLGVPTFVAPFTPCVELAYRLSRDAWGLGYATEAAERVLAFAFDELALPEVVAFTTVTNVRSRRVMEKLGMTRDPSDDFEHPDLPEGHPLRPHVLYRRTRSR